jgi:hypothetical protein
MRDKPRLSVAKRLRQAAKCAAMQNDPEYFDPDADDRALALHEAGHAIVAHELGA